MSILAKVIAAFFAASLTWLSPANADEGATLEKIRTSGAMTIGYRDTAIPFSYVGADQKPIGFSLDLCGLVAEKVKQRLRLDELKIDYKPVTPANRAALLKDGAVDVECSATPETADLARDASFLNPGLRVATEVDCASANPRGQGWGPPQRVRSQDAFHCR